MTPLSLRPPTLEALHCFTLGLRDALRPRLALVSILIWTLALVFWGVVLAVFHAEASALVAQALSAIWSAAPSWMSPAAAVAQNPWVQGTVSFLLLALGYWIVCLITVSLLMELMLMQRVQAVCLPRYPALQGLVVHNNSLAAVRDTVGTLCTMVVGTLVCLLIPVVGGALALVLVGYLNVRGLVGDALDGVATDQERRQIIERHRPQMLLLGLMCSVLMFVPLVGLWMPAVLGAATAHLGMRATQRLRGLA
ncbi:MAG TPA: EI24 domain-containing protein [Aquabacterium sp.]|nr:EI24 domain-containing protein [Aquabacterium sp.]